MHFKLLIQELESSDEYKIWKENHQNYFLAHIFNVDQGSSWQIGYSDGEKASTFTLNPISVEDSDELNKRPDVKVLPFDIDKLTLTYEKAMELFDGLLKEKYAQEQIFKKIIIIQNVDNKEVYNITGLTHTFKTLNVKIDMQGNILEDSLVALMEQ
ncbi:hypothetical protein KY321_01280 [Candidatus Woesearchaeota archaeon]|nr:hypothetical protein [Candidatus Woesearchaeota archaeon]